MKVNVPGLVVNAPGELRLIPFNIWVWAVMDVVGLTRLMELVVCVPDDGAVGADAVRVRPLTATPAPELAFWKERFSRLAAEPVRDVSVMAWMVPDAVVLVWLKVPDAWV